LSRYFVAQKKSNYGIIQREIKDNNDLAEDAAYDCIHLKPVEHIVHLAMSTKFAITSENPHRVREDGIFPTTSAGF